MPRMHRENYIICFTQEYEKLILEYEQDNSEATTNRILGLLDEKSDSGGRQLWIEFDFNHSNRKRWALLRKGLKYYTKYHLIIYIISLR